MTTTPKHVLIGVLQNTLITYYQKLKESTMSMTNENQYIVPKDENFNTCVKELFLYKAKPEDPAGIRRVRIGRTADSPRYVYFWDDEKTLDCVGGGNDEVLAAFHHDPINIAILYELLGMEILKVGDRQYHVSWDGYDFHITETFPPVVGNVEADGETTRHQTDQESSLNTTQEEADHTHQSTDAKEGSIESDVRVQEPEEVEKNVETLYRVLMCSFELMEVDPASAETICMGMSQSRTYGGAFPNGVANMPPNPFPQNTMTLVTPLISRMLEEVSFQEGYEYALFRRGVMVVQDPEGNYRIKLKIPNTNAVAVVEYKHRRVTPPFSLL